MGQVRGLKAQALGREAGLGGGGRATPRAWQEQGCGGSAATAPGEPRTQVQSRLYPEHRLAGDGCLFSRFPDQQA